MFCHISRLALFLVIFLIAPGLAVAACRVDVTPVVTLDTPFPQVVYDRSKSRAVLSARAQAHSARPDMPKQSTAGLTSYKFATRFTFTGAMGKVDGKWCFRARQVNLSVGYDRITVLIDRKYVSRSCEYSVILDHENRHVEILRESVDLVAEEMRAALQRGLRLRGAAAGATQNQARQALGRVVTEMMRPYIKQMSDYRRTQNAAIDTPASYDQSRRECQNW
ncbi:hypothetical protein GH722_18660 [Alphaproteobacteria bacterium HT1-32]|nr:hypothetical protein [Alphaproteobacteria bacterium HT1-32]